MSQTESKPDLDAQSILESVHQELRAGFLQSIPSRIATIESIMGAFQQDPGDVQSAQDLHAETHRLAGTTAVYGLMKVSAVARRFDGLLRDFLEGGRRVPSEELETFLHELAFAIRSET